MVVLDQKTQEQSVFWGEIVVVSADHIYREINADIHEIPKCSQTFFCRYILWSKANHLINFVVKAWSSISVHYRVLPNHLRVFKREIIFSEVVSTKSSSRHSRKIMNESQRDTDGVCGLKTHRSHPALWTLDPLSLVCPVPLARLRYWCKTEFCLRCSVLWMCLCLSADGLHQLRLSDGF